VIDVRTKDGNMREYHGSVTVGLVSSKVQLEGPILKDRASFNVAYRRTYLDLLLKPIFAAANASMEGEKDYVSYYFDDLNGKLNYKFSDRSRLYFNWYSGVDALDVNQELRTGPSISSSSATEDNGVKWKWGNRLASLNWNYVISSKLFANTSLIYSRFRSRISLYNKSSFELDGDLTRSEFEMRNSSGIEDIGYRLDFDYMLHTRHYVRFGSNYLFHTFHPEESVITSRGEYGGDVHDKFPACAYSCA
jgi:hypothetical protein